MLVRTDIRVWVIGKDNIAEKRSMRKVAFKGGKIGRGGVLTERLFMGWV